MTKEEVIEMLKDIVEEVDYDIFKAIFLYGELPPEDQQQLVDNLVSEVAKHIDIEE